MSLINLSISPDRIAVALERIADAIDRAYPPDEPTDWLTPSPDAVNGQTGQTGQAPSSDDHITVNESAEDYDRRVSADAALAGSLGIDSLSREFSVAVSDLKRNLMAPRMELNEETGTVERLAGLSADEAEDVVRKAFQLAKAEATVRV